jgi:ferredoxin
MNKKATYQALAKHLDTFPHGFPPSKSGIELLLLAYLFTPEEAELALTMSLTYKPLREITKKAGLSSSNTQALVKNMSNKGLVKLRLGPDGPDVSLLPFVVGFYENQVFRLDETFARIYEDYYHEALYKLMLVQPQFHRVIPVNTPIDSAVEILPEEDVTFLVSQKKAWAVLDCICRKQQALLGQACSHPIRVCLAMSDTPGAFDGIDVMDALDLTEALEVLEEAAQAGLVHTVSNQKREISYVCSCCTCGCGLLRGIADLHIANIVARSANYAVVDKDKCTGCGTCEEKCQFNAIRVDQTAIIDRNVCVGCGVCVRVCPETAITLHKRPSKEIKPIPENEEEWISHRLESRRKMNKHKPKKWI